MRAALPGNAAVRSYRRCRSMTAGSTSRSNPTAVLAFEAPLHADQDAQRVGVGRLADRQDVEQVREAAVALCRRAALRRDLADHADVVAFQVRLQHLGGVRVEHAEMPARNRPTRSSK